MFNPQFGLINALIEQIGQLFGQQWLGPGWLASVAWAKPTLVLMNVWLIGQPMIIYLASLQDVPQDLLDAAAVDGATWFQQLRNVTIPMVTPVIFYQLVTGLIGSLQLFTQPWVITAGQGSPAQSMMFYAMQLYRQAFVYFNMGQAEAMAWALFLVVLVLSFLVFKSSARWVYYGGADEKK
jgi:multiple sugar transport system permease protein